jgi:hypothetical protein
MLGTRISYSAVNMKMRLRRIIKRTLQGLCLVFVFPSALLCAFGQIKVFYIFFAQLFALFPGIVGTFLRSAFYKYALRQCSIDTAISFGTFFPVTMRVLERMLQSGVSV